MDSVPLSEPARGKGAMKAEPLKARDLYKRGDLSQVNLKTTADLLRIHGKADVLALIETGNGYRYRGG
jgi:hypothetical protein